MTFPGEIKQLTCGDAEAYDVMFDGWSHSMTQLDAGRFDYAGWSIRLPGLQIYLDNHTRSIRWSEFSHVPVTAVYIPVTCEGSVRWQGRELRGDSAVIQGRNFEHNFAAGTSARSIYLDIDDGLIRRMGWTLPPNRSVVLNRDYRGKTCRGLLCVAVVASAK